MLAPGDPDPGSEGAGPSDCGGARLRICGDDCADARGAERHATAAMAMIAIALQRQKVLKPHPDIAFFLDHKGGIFMPPNNSRGFKTGLNGRGI